LILMIWNFFTLNWVDNSMIDNEFDYMFAAKYESFLVDDEVQYDMFEFDNLCSSIEYFIASASTFESLSLLGSLKLKPLPDSLKHTFLVPDESLPVIITCNLDWDQEEQLITLLRENKEAIGWTLGNIKGISPSIVQHRILWSVILSPTVTIKGI